MAAEKIVAALFGKYHYCAICFFLFLGKSTCKMMDLVKGKGWVSLVKSGESLACLMVYVVLSLFMVTQGMRKALSCI